MIVALPRVILARALFLALAICCNGFANAAEVVVTIDNFVFNPPTIAIKSGDTVTWRNADDIPHSIVSTKPGAFRSRALDTDDKYSFTFTTAGTFEYFCGLHPHMKAMITVTP
jgi:plastocyanin